MTSSGPDHEKTFTARAQVAGELFAASTGSSKKEAEQLAAETAWRAISGRPARPDEPAPPPAPQPADAG
jgi:ribonuclease-3